MIVAETMAEYAATVYNGVHESHNMCDSNPLYYCTNGWYGWCDDGWDHDCCFQTKSPSNMNCNEASTCHYVCCDWPASPCGTSLCCESPEICTNSQCIIPTLPPTPTPAPTTATPTSLSPTKNPTEFYESKTIAISGTIVIVILMCGCFVFCYLCCIKKDGPFRELLLQK